MNHGTNVNVKFTILYDKDDYHALYSDCERIVRETEQTVWVEVPQEVIGILQNLNWAKKLDLVVSIEGHSSINLRDREVRSNIISNKNRPKQSGNRVGRIFSWLFSRF